MRRSRILFVPACLLFMAGCSADHAGSDPADSAADAPTDSAEVTTAETLLAETSVAETVAAETTVAETTVAETSDAETSDGETTASLPTLATATIGPAGGTLDGPGVHLIVPAGALKSETTLRFAGPAPLPAGHTPAPTLYSQVLALEPAGLAFEVPATIRFDVAGDPHQPTVFWTDSPDPTHFQQLPTRLTPGAATAPIVHFSTVYLADPTTNTNGWFCCAPIDPQVTTDADCIDWNAGTGTTCDLSVCTLSPGACPTDPPQAGCCAPLSPNPADDEPTTGCANLLTYGQCALGVGAGFCAWSSNCSTATPTCCAPSVAGQDNPTIPCAFLASYGACTGAPACSWSASATCPVPTPGQPPCASCVDPTYTASPAFVGAAQTTWQQLGGASCGTLGASPIAPPTAQPGDPAYASQLGAFCAYDAALQAHACSAPAPQCPNLPTSCCVANGAAQPTGTTCDAITSYVDCTLIAGAGFCGWNPVCGPPSGAGCCAPINPANDHPGLPCAQMPDAAECVASLGYGYCQWDPTGACPSADPCDACTDPVFLNDPDFQTAQQSWLANHTSPSCGTLAASPIPAPSGAVGTPQWATAAGAWCAYQQSAVGLGCTNPVPECPNLPTDCCFDTDPGNPLMTAGGCSAQVSQFDCEYNVGLHFCTWNPSCGLATPTQCCVQIDPSEDEPLVGCANIPDYGECVNSLGFGYCQWDPSAQCPLPASLSCAYCQDPQYIGDTDVQTAYINSFTSNFLSGCSAMAASPVPSPAGVPTQVTGQATVYETQLGRWCGWEAAFAAHSCVGSPSTVIPACPPLPMPATCCTSVVPGIDPPTASCGSLTSYGDCTQGTGSGTCQWNPGPTCPVPPSPACADCLDPQVANDPDVQFAAQQSSAAYLAAGCGLMVQSPVPPPSLPVSVSSSGATPWETQEGRFCGFEAAWAQAQCLPTPTFAPTCPGFPVPPTCCSPVTPGMNPPIGTCAALVGPSACLANAGICQYTPSALCPSPTQNTCAPCADPSHLGVPAFTQAFTASYSAYLTNGCGTLAASPVPPPSQPIGTTTYETQLGRFCGFQEALTAAGCGAPVSGPVCNTNLCQTTPSLCPAPLPTCSACASLAGSPGFQTAFTAAFTPIALGGCLAAQTAGPPAITAAFGSPAYGAQVGAYCGWQTAMQQNCNSPGCPGTGCADCLDPQWTSDPIFFTALQQGWTRYGAETCPELATLAIPPPNQPAGTSAFKAQLGRWCAFEQALEKNSCGGSSCPGLSMCAPSPGTCILPAPTCSECTNVVNTSQPAWQVAFATETLALVALGCNQLYAQTTPPIVTAAPNTAPYMQQLGTWCAYQDQLDTKCGHLYSQCTVP